MWEFISPWVVFLYESLFLSVEIISLICSFSEDGFYSFLLHMPLMLGSIYFSYP